ncbi:MAG: type IV pilus secretin PilQ [Candidatus Schekmanbacteria bacterium]|nr:type IV pilus secretin PilQ [Candidatus Schekmanbacteria bacterium]
MGLKKIKCLRLFLFVFIGCIVLSGCSTGTKNEINKQEPGVSAEPLRSETLVEGINFINTTADTIITLKVSKPVEYSSYLLSDPVRIVLEVTDSRLSPGVPEMTSVNGAVVTGVTLKEEEGMTKIVKAEIELLKNAERKIESNGNFITITIKNPQGDENEAVEAEASGSESDVKKIKEALMGNEEGKKSLTTEISREKEYARAKPAGFSGDKISLDLQNADVEDVIRLIAEISGMNFVIEEGVRGKINIKLDNTPWDQALDLVLKINTPQLVLVKDEGIYRVMTLDKSKRIRKEKAEEAVVRKEEKEAEEAVQPLITKTIRLSYAKAKTIEPVVKNFMSSRVKTDALLTTDERTNSLIIKDIIPSVEQIENVIRQLDRPTPEVEILAKIVEIDEGFDRALGIQWGANLVKSPATGNATGHEFPNSINLSGIVGDENNPSQSGKDFLVNLPIADKTSGLGLILGNVNNTFNLEVQLSALESQNKVKLLNNPKLLVVDNEKAKIQVGNQLPSVIIDEQGKQSIEWKDIGIILEVTPQITADGSIFMDVSLEKSRQGSNVQIQTGQHYSIVKTESQTKVLIKSGETAVIGGLTEKTDDTSSSRTPFLSKVPLIGNFFKNRTTSQSSSEILIFLTPRIVEAYMQ